MFIPRACPPAASQLASSSSHNPAATNLDPFFLPPDRLTQKARSHFRSRRWSRLSVRAKVAVGEGGRNILVKESPPAVETGGGIEISGRCPSRLEYPGRGIDHGERSMVKPALRTQKARVIVIAGPTAVGKTRVALALAKQLGGEIIGADSVQVKTINLASCFPHCESTSKLAPTRISSYDLNWVFVAAALFLESRDGLVGVFAICLLHFLGEVIFGSFPNLGSNSICCCSERPKHPLIKSRMQDFISGDWVSPNLRSNCLCCSAITPGSSFHLWVCEKEMCLCLAGV